MMRIFYHGTSEENWKKIQKSRQLFDGHCTYLATDKEEALCYGCVLLEIEYDPTKNPDMNNYCEDCWQFRVYEPIELSKIKRLL